MKCEGGGGSPRCYITERYSLFVLPFIAHEGSYYSGEGSVLNSQLCFITALSVRLKLQFSPSEVRYC